MDQLKQDQKKKNTGYCRIVLRDSKRSFDREYTYLIPDNLQDRIRIGSWVEVPFGSGNRFAEGYVTALLSQTDADYRLKPVFKLLSDNPVLLPDQLHLAIAMRSRYLCTYGDALKCMVPAAVTAVQDKTVRMVALTDPDEAQRSLSEGELDRLGHIRVIELLLDNEQAPLQEVMKACGVSRAVLKTLEKRQLIHVFSQKTRRILEMDQVPERQAPFQPTPAQATAIRRVRESAAHCTLEQSGCQEFLLFGVTGSGKTEVYLQLTHDMITQNRGTIILVPEIALTPQMIARIRARFGANVAVLHSRLTPSERFEQWQRIIRQEVKVVVGARSAVFAPLADIGLIIIDEEQESTYKSETHPRYHARDIARLRAREQGAALILGSATPAVETMYRCMNGQMILLSLADRIGSAGMAKARIIDMREELRQGNRDIFSLDLQKAMHDAFAAGHQAMIFINRRGYAGFMLCRSCGQVIKCRTCSVAMTSHQNRHAASSGAGAEQLICHYCGKISRPPKTCPACGSRYIGRFGIGTQQVEERFNQVFAPHRALRMDQDTTSGRSAHEKILHAFAEGEAEALIGTQMIAKGHDFANVTVVGVLTADIMLGMSDFRASERAFQLITQAAGRAGRGELPGLVMIQAYNVDDYAIRFAAAQDYDSFYRQEITYRKMMQYPPFGSITAITLTGHQEQQVQRVSRDLASALRARKEEHQDYKAISLMDPARAPLYKIKNRYRWRLILKTPSSTLAAAFLAPVTDRFAFGEVTVAIDHDPYQLW